MEYNTERLQIVLKEYGRNIQVMVNNLMEIEDKERRSAQAKNLVELMKQFVQPGSKENNDLTHKVWDDLFIISEYKLDIDGPYPKPDVTVITKRPSPLSYSYSNPFFRHYGKNIELLVKSVSAMDNEEEKNNGAIYIGRLMKTFYIQYSKDVIEDTAIIEQLKKLSSNSIVLDIEKIKSENLFETSGVKMERKPQNNPSQGEKRMDNRRNNSSNKNMGKNNIRRRK